MNESPWQFVIWGVIGWRRSYRPSLSSSINLAIGPRSIETHGCPAKSNVKATTEPVTDGCATVSIVKPSGTRNRPDGSSPAKASRPQGPPPTTPRSRARAQSPSSNSTVVQPLPSGT